MHFSWLLPWVEVGLCADFGLFHRPGTSTSCGRPRKGHITLVSCAAVEQFWGLASKFCVLCLGCQPALAAHAEVVHRCTVSQVLSCLGADSIQAVTESAEPPSIRQPLQSSRQTNDAVHNNALVLTAHIERTHSMVQYQDVVRRLMQVSAEP